MQKSKKCDISILKFDKRERVSFDGKETHVLPFTHKKMKIIFVDIRIFGSKVIFFIIIFRLYKCYIWLYRCYTSYTGENGKKNPKLYRLF